MALAVLLLIGTSSVQQPTPTAQTASYIVQAESLEAAAQVVTSVGGTVTHQLGIIDAVAARFTPQQLENLARQPNSVRIFEDATARSATTVGGDILYVRYPALVDADDLHDIGINGDGVAVAVVDSGAMHVVELNRDPADVNRMHRYNALTDDGRRGPGQEWPWYPRQ